MRTAFDAAKTEHLSRLGAVAAGETLRLRVLLPRSFGVTACTLIIHKDGEDPQSVPLDWESTNGYDEWWRKELSFGAGLWFYHLSYQTAWGTTVLHKNPSDFSAGVEGDEDWQLTVYPPEAKTPESIRGGIIYQIFPDRFYDSGTKKEGVPADRILHRCKTDAPVFLPDETGEIRNNDYFGGDLKGITEKLPYLASLGVSLIYLNPICEAHSNHRYNTADYLKTDPLLGTDADFAELCKKAHAFGMGVIVDGVFSHTGDDSVYFNKKGRYPGPGAYQSNDSPYRSWYSFGENRDDYKSWWNIDTLPEVNENDPGFTAFITGENGVIDRWMNLGADGYRLDVADELPDEFLDRVRIAVKRHGEERYLLGEVWEDASNKWSHGGRRRYFDGRQLDGVMNYPFRDAILDFCLTADAPKCMTALMKIVLHYPPGNLHVCMNLLGTHDTARILTLLAGVNCDALTREAQSKLSYTDRAMERAKNLLRMAAAINYLLPGLPAIYYGDEAGMTGGKDPFNRGFFPWGKEDESLVDYFRCLGRIRRNYSVLQSGGFYPLSAALGCIAFLRYQQGHRRLALIANRNPDTIHYVLNGDMRNMRCILNGERTADGVVVPGETAVILADG